MKDLLLDSNNDLSIQDGDLALTQTSQQSIAQTCKIRLQTLKGEWFLNESIGVPYLDILGRKVSDQHVSHVVRESLNNIEGVKEVTSINTQYRANNRTLSLSYKIETEADTNINGEISFGGNSE